MAEIPGTQKISGALEINAFPSNSVSSTGAVKTIGNNPSGIALSQVALTDVNTPFSYGSGTSVLLQSDPANTNDIVFGDAANRKFFTLIPGQVMYYPYNIINVSTKTGTANLTIMQMQP